MKKALAIFALLVCVGCAKQVVAPVPGQTNSADAVAFRVAADAQAALHSIKTWEECAAANFPQTLSIDGTPEPCDPAAGPFPPKLVPLLNVAITSYKTLEQLGQAFHDGTNTDQPALEAAETKLQSDVSAVLAGGK